MAKDLTVKEADEVAGIKKWLAQFFVFSFWPALIITVILGVPKIFGVQFPITRWWDVLFIPLIYAATMMTWKKLDGSNKIGPVILFFIGGGIVIVTLVDSKIIILDRAPGLYEIIAFSAIPVLATVIYIIYGAIKKKLNAAYLDSSLNWASIITWSIFSGYMFFYSIVFGSWNIDWFILMLLAFFTIILSVGSAGMTAIVAGCIYGIIAVHRIAFKKPSKK